MILFKPKTVGLLFCALLLSGCANDKVASQSSGSDSNKKEAKKTVINLAGSGSSAAFVKLLEVPFKDKYPNFELNFLPSSGSGDGVKGVGEGNLDIGLSARAMKIEERKKFPNLVEYFFVKDPMVMVVNSSVNIKNLNSNELVGIFTGKISNWKQLKGPDAKIVLLDREESESSKMLLRTKILGKDLKVTPEAMLINSANTMDKAVDETKFSLGQTSLGLIKVGGYKNIVPVAVDGVEPLAKNILNNTYPLVRDFSIIVDSGTTKSGVKEFVDFLFSKEAKDIFSKYEVLPLDKP